MDLDLPEHISSIHQGVQLESSPRSFQLNTLDIPLKLNPNKPAQVQSEPLCLSSALTLSPNILAQAQLKLRSNSALMLASTQVQSELLRLSSEQTTSPLKLSQNIPAQTQHLRSALKLSTQVQSEHSRLSSIQTVPFYFFVVYKNRQNCMNKSIQF